MSDEQTLTFKQFLETTPPGVTKQISNLHFERRTNNSLSAGLAFPEIEVYCDHKTCVGLRIFRPVNKDYSQSDTKKHLFSDYMCSNCRKSIKTYALTCEIGAYDGSDLVIERSISGSCYKHGEHPPFGPPLPNRLIRLFQSERDSLLKAIRCENQGLGIAAFAYYRRVIENKKDDLFDRIIKVAETVGASKELVNQLVFDKSNIQFSNSASVLTSAVPDVLLFGGENPLLLLHNTLSAGIHGRSDEECLKDSHDIRLILIELVRLIDNTLAEKEELKNAIKRLSDKKKPRT